MLFKTMSYNIEYGGQEDELDNYIKMITAESPDVCCFQEIYSEDLYYESLTNDSVEAPEETVCQAIADQLDMYWVQSKVKLGMGILSKHHIEEVISNEKSVLAVELDNGIVIANCHFTDEPCTYYSLRGLSYDNTPENLSCPLKAANLLYKAKENELEHLFSLVSNDKPSIIMGDFNEPSHLDWNEQTVKSGIVPCKVPWKTSQSFIKNGFQDVARTIYPDPVSHPLQTCDVLNREGVEGVCAERIDFMYASKAHFRPISSLNIFVPYSDHLPIVSSLQILMDNNTRE